jgi:hypothetical protein
MNELLFVLGPLAMAVGLGMALWGLVLEKRSRGPRTATAKPGDDGPTTRIMACPGCGRRLRLPGHGGSLRVTCPGCRHAFQIRPD